MTNPRPHPLPGACDLADRTCEPCRGGIPPLSRAQIEPLARELGSAWRVVDDHHLERTFSFPDWKSALAFVNRISDPAEEMGHHPNVDFTWGRVTIRIYTHKIDGLHEADFILAAKINRIVQGPYTNGPLPLTDNRCSPPDQEDSRT